MGGPIPGMGCGTGGRFKAVGLDTAGRRVTTTFTEHSTWNGVPNVCQDGDSAVTVTSADEVTVKHANYYCNWMGIGNMASTFVMAIDYIDLDKGRMGGYWAHAVVGTGGGRGTGYAIMQFPQAMKKDENWLKTVLLDKKCDKRGRVWFVGVTLLSSLRSCSRPVPVRRSSPRSRR